MIDVQATDVFKKWLDRLRDHKAVGAIKLRIANFRQGLLGDVKSVGEGVLEARLHISAGYRVYFVIKGDKIIILLCGGTKGSQLLDIAKAKRIKRDNDL